MARGAPHRTGRTSRLLGLAACSSLLATLAHAHEPPRALAGLGPRVDRSASASDVSVNAVLDVVASGSQALGMIAGGKSATTFQIGGDGSVTAHGGDFVRLRGGSVGPQRVTVSCTTVAQAEDGCESYSGVWVTVSGGPASNWPGASQNFRIAGGVQGAELADSNLGHESSSFFLTCSGGQCAANTQISFDLAFEVVLQPSPAVSTASAEFGYRVEAVWQ